VEFLFYYKVSVINIKVTRVEQQVIRKSHSMWKVIDENCFYAKNLYNLATYTVRQEFVNNKRWIKYGELDKMLQQTDAYKELMSQPAQCTLKMVDLVWKSFFVSIKDWNKNPSKYLGMPKLPKYLKKDGRHVWQIKNNSCRINPDGEIFFTVKRLKGYRFHTKAKGRLICVRFIPRGHYYMMEVVTEIEVPDKADFESKRIASIDLGVNNFVTLTNNIGEKPIIINGRSVKAINQLYNKRKAKMQSELKKRHDRNWSEALSVLTFKRNMRVKDFMHNVSRCIVDWCIENEIDTLVVGHNKNWKQECSMSKTSNQKFVYLPYDMLLRQLAYKCEDVGMKFIENEESYTSGTSFLDSELPTTENYDKSRRITRGLFQSKRGLINADVNGSLQIMKKVFPNAFSYGIGVECLQPIVLRFDYYKAKKLA
jgi:putative transposase